MKNYEEHVIEELLKSIQGTNSLITTLMDDVKENAINMAVLEEKISTLSENVNNLSSIVKNGNGLVTKMALIENEIENINAEFENINKKFEDIEECMENIKKHYQKEKELEVKYERKKTLAVLKTIAIISPGIISLVLYMLSKI